MLTKQKDMIRCLLLQGENRQNSLPENAISHKTCMYFMQEDIQNRFFLNFIVFFMTGIFLNNSMVFPSQCEL